MAYKFHRLLLTFFCFGLVFLSQQIILCFEKNSFDLSSEEILRDVFSPFYNYLDVEYIGKVVFSYPEEPVITAFITYQHKPPDKWKIKINSIHGSLKGDDYLYYQEGLTIAIDQNKLTKYEPRGLDNFEAGDLIQYNQATSLTGVMNQLELIDYLGLIGNKIESSRLINYEIMDYSKVIVDNRPAYMITMIPAKFMKISTVHLISRILIWIDSEYHIPIKIEAYDQKNNLVTSVIYSDLYKLKNNKYVSLYSEITIHTGSIQVSREVDVTDNEVVKDKQFWTTDFLYPGKVIQKKLKVIEDIYCLPEKMTVLTINGHIIEKWDFMAHKVNKNISDSDFILEMR